MNTSEISARAAPPRIALSSVSLAARTRREARQILEDVSIEIAAGDVVSVVGHSGAGKSTLLKLVAGLEHPTRGTVAMSNSAGSPVRIGLSPQSPALMPWLTVGENLDLAMKLAGMAPSPDQNEAWLTRLKLSGRQLDKPSALSGGMRSRVALARALVTQPDLLLLDEPFGSLDEGTAEAIMADLARILADRVVTCLLVSHNLRQACFLADRVIVLSPWPAGIVADLRVDHLRPRSLELMDSPEFNKTVSEIGRLLRKDSAQ